LGLGRLRVRLGAHRRIAIDSNIFIYQLQTHPRYGLLADSVFEWLGHRGREAVTATITMTELLVHPYRNLDTARIGEFYALLSTYPNLEWVAPDLAIADLAARLRAGHGMRAPDALQAATAIHAEATALVTNDAVFERLNKFEVLVLDRFI
jgi:predicted nucleic acid-binding protein